MASEASEHLIAAGTIKIAIEIPRFAGNSMLGEFPQGMFEDYSKSSIFDPEGMTRPKDWQEALGAISNGYQCMAEACLHETGEPVYTGRPGAIEEWQASQISTNPAVTSLASATEGDGKYSSQLYYR